MTIDDNNTWNLLKKRSPGEQLLLLTCWQLLQAAAHLLQLRFAKSFVKSSGLKYYVDNLFLLLTSCCCWDAVRLLPPDPASNCWAANRLAMSILLQNLSMDLVWKIITNTNTKTNTYADNQETGYEPSSQTFGFCLGMVSIFKGMIYNHQPKIRNRVVQERGRTVIVESHFYFIWNEF